MSVILGISAHYHDSAAALVVDGELKAAAQEERFTRVKGDSSFPHHSIHHCLDLCELRLGDVEQVVYYESPLAKFSRILTSHLSTSPRSLRSFLRGIPNWLTDKLWLEQSISKTLGVNRPVLTCDHHLAHAASAFYPSPFDRAAILTIDGVGEWSTATWGRGMGVNITLEQELRFPDSVGLLYSAFTYFTGFKVNSGEYKLMGLAPYGSPIYADTIRKELVEIFNDGSIRLNQAYFDYVGGLRMVSGRFEALFGGLPRAPEAPIARREMDIAASIQDVLNEIVLKMARHVRRQTGESKLVMAGGVALNVVANGQLALDRVFDELWIQPAAGDAGGAVGAALWLHHQANDKRKPVLPDGMSGALLGNEIRPGDSRDDESLRAMGAVWKELDEAALVDRIARDVAAGKVVGLARGRMEFGPRALGNRSILGDARSPEMQRHMNLKIKFRESFRPFAAIVLESESDKYFVQSQNSPYMLMAWPVRDERRTDHNDASGIGLSRINEVRSDIPAVTHVDHSCRVQTVDEQRYPFIHALLSRFRDLCGCGMMINTSFNVRGEPIVSTAEDAYRCFLATEIDVVVIGNRYMTREQNRGRVMSEKERENWRSQFALD